MLTNFQNPSLIFCGGCFGVYTMYLCTQGRLNGQYTLIDKYMWEHLQINHLS
jgi:hypothetical protein